MENSTFHLYIVHLQIKAGNFFFERNILGQGEVVAYYKVV